MRKRGHHVLTNGIGVWLPVARADDGILLRSIIADDPASYEPVTQLPGSGPQLACGRLEEGSPAVVRCMDVGPGNVHY